MSRLLPLAYTIRFWMSSPSYPISHWFGENTPRTIWHHCAPTSVSCVPYGFPHDWRLEGVCHDTTDRARLSPHRFGLVSALVRSLHVGGIMAGNWSFVIYRIVMTVVFKWGGDMIRCTSTVASVASSLCDGRCNPDRRTPPGHHDPKTVLRFRMMRVHQRNIVMPFCSIKDHAVTIAAR
jgi:hypothetical protein